jgi:hypothetical protein
MTKRSMAKHRRQSGLVGAALLGVLASVSLLTAACGDPLPPDVLTWENDIFPIMKARCIRCHTGTPGRMDPALGMRGAAIPDFDHPTFTELFDDKAAFGFASILDKFVVGKGMAPATTIMPPPPAEPLESWQVKWIQIWARAPK